MTKLDYISYKQGYYAELDTGLISNWPAQDEPPKKEPPNSIWFIDMDGDSVAEAKTIGEARSLKKLFPGSILREYSPKLSDIEEQQAEARHEKRYQNCF